ncbi:MAG: DHH family phosphoesterase [Sulfurovum sp.]|nr:DHH family phosphoesterase [Sulfurovum sp.]
MPNPLFPFEEVKEQIAQASHITILTHINPDADTIGTGLGIYAMLKKDKSKKIEIVNVSHALPVYLDFLPNYHKIKDKMDYHDSLIIACDAGSADRLGVEVQGRTLLNIDHHHTNTGYGTINVVLGEYASSSQVGYGLFESMYEIGLETAICFYTALLSDTQYFTSKTVNKEVFDFAQRLIEKGVKPDEVAYHFTKRRSLASLRILERGLASLSLYEEARVSVICISKEDIVATGAKVHDMEGLVDYAQSLATVEIAILAMELEGGIRISLRSTTIDISRLALVFGGGGHKGASGFTLSEALLEESIEKILQQIKILGYMNGV